MSLMETIACLVSLCALFGYINHRWVKLPTTIGLMLISLVSSLIIVGIGKIVPGAQGVDSAASGTAIQDWALRLLAEIDFNETVMHGMLGSLLFAGALHVNLNDLARQKLIVAVSATVGVAVSTFVVGVIAWLVFGVTGLDVPLIYCLLFGALISPTDPIAVLGILKKLGAPKELETQICGESLFNDGVGVVLFMVIMSLAGLSSPSHDRAVDSTRHHQATVHEVTALVVQDHALLDYQSENPTPDLTTPSAHDEPQAPSLPPRDTVNANDVTHDHTGPTAGGVLGLFLKETGGGVLFGLALGLIGYGLLKTVDNYQVEILISLALVLGGYALASHLHLSAPIAMVVVGLLIGNHGRRLAMSARTREHLDTFWELVDEILNAVLFVLIGLEVVVLTFTGRHVLVGMFMIPVVLGARFVAVGLPVQVLRRRGWQTFAPHTVKVMTWAGLRGGISVALALSIPREINGVAVAPRDLILTVTYIVVVFSILVQGLTLSPLLARLGVTDKPNTDLGHGPPPQSSTDEPVTHA